VWSLAAYIVSKKSKHSSRPLAHIMPRSSPPPHPPHPKKLIGSGRFPQVALVGAGGSGPLDPPLAQRRPCLSRVLCARCLREKMSLTDGAVGADTLPPVADARQSPRDLWRHTASYQLVASACRPHVLWGHHVRTSHRCTHRYTESWARRLSQ